MHNKINRNILTNINLCILINILLFQSILFSEEYVCFSLNAAKNKIATSINLNNTRNTLPEVYTISGITELTSLVLDSISNDIILVGKRNPERAELTIDDFVISLRARFIKRRWPVVSIDPINMDHFMSGSIPKCGKDLQIAHYAGGIENTQFGKDLFESDYLLKKIGMGFANAGILNFKSIIDWANDFHIENKYDKYINISRQWFYPIFPKISFREGIAVLGNIKIGVFTELLYLEINGNKINNLDSYEDYVSSKFVKSFEINFIKIAQNHHCLLRLLGLAEMVAFSKALEDMGNYSNIGWWLKYYTPLSIETPDTLDILSVNYANGSGKMMGGIELTALSFKIQTGDILALKKLILVSRPKTNSLTWSFSISKDKIQVDNTNTNITDEISGLVAHANYLQRWKHFNDAISVYNHILTINPNLSSIYWQRGIAYQSLNKNEDALADYNVALNVNPNNSVLLNRGLIFSEMGKNIDAIIDFSRLILLIPEISEPYVNRANCYFRLKKYDKALNDCNTAIYLNPRDGLMYYNRGYLLLCMKHYERAISDFDKSLILNPDFAISYLYRGFANRFQEKYKLAILDFNEAIKRIPQCYIALFYRATSNICISNFNDAISDLDTILKLENKNYIYEYMGHKFSLDFLSVLKKDIYYWRGICYMAFAEYENALNNFDMAIIWDNNYAEAFYQKAKCYNMFGNKVEALKNIDKAIKLFSNLDTNSIEKYKQYRIYILNNLQNSNNKQ